jgi:hypothetical protein
MGLRWVAATVLLAISWIVFLAIYIFRNWSGWFF